jgi:anti-sigma-K factor RskA
MTRRFLAFSAAVAALQISKFTPALAQSVNENPSAASLQRQQFATVLRSIQDSRDKELALEGLQPSGTRVFEFDTIQIRDHGNNAVLPAFSVIERNRAGITVIDPQSHQSLSFSPDAKISLVPRGGHYLARPGATLPVWLTPANARLLRVVGR